MSHFILPSSLSLPASQEITERIRACRDELAALRKLQRMVRAAEAAETARNKRAQRQGVPGHE
jgi:hypothetical protein